MQPGDEGSAHSEGSDALESEFVPDLWYFAESTRRLRPAEMVRKRLLGKSLLIGRSATGEPFALDDVCPHRGMPLSYGEFDGEEIECPYHGWRFGVDGACRSIPSLTSSQRLNLAKIRVRRYPCRAVQGNIWLYFGDDEPDPADIPMIPDVGIAEYRIFECLEFPSHVDHAVIGLMDPAHGPFVHRSWWWRSPCFDP